VKTSADPRLVKGKRVVGVLESFIRERCYLKERFTQNDGVRVGLTKKKTHRSRNVTD